MASEGEGSGVYVTIARVAKTQGRHGEVAADLYTDFPEKFAERKRLFALAEDGSRRELQVEDHWPHKGWMVLKFVGIDSIDDAEKLLRCELQIPIGERAELEEGAAFVSELIGCVVWDFAGSQGEPKEVGAVKDVQFGAGEAPTLVVVAGTREHLIPYAAQFLRKLDTVAKRIEMELPEGLLELDAPLSQDEKKQQQRD
ncbi:MAG: rRNA processing protein RimM [Candidatus Angelobacter sp.]|nr:rRNA processing protein RimM [Candidatus Angelobacter sp.]